MKLLWKPKRILVKTIKVLGWFVLSVILLLVALSVAIQIPAVQNAIVQKAVTFLHDKIGTEVRLAHVSLSFPKKVVLDGLYLEDQRHDTLLYIGELAVDTDLWGLTRNTIELNDVEIDTLRGYISRSARDSAFNFDYIIKAFASADTTTVKDTTATPWKFSIEDIALHNTRFAFRDSLERNDIQLRSEELSISMDEFDLTKSIIKADEIALENVSAMVTQRPAAAPRPDSTTAALPDTASLPFDLGVNTVRLKSVKAFYTNHTTAQRIELDLGNAELDAEAIDLQKQTLQLHSFTLEKTFIAYHQMANVTPGAQPKETAGKKTPESKKVQDTRIASTPWTISLDELNLSDNSIQYYDFNQPAVKDAIDFNHLWITNFSMQAEDLKMKGIDIAGKLEDLTLQDKSGFTISSFKTDFALTDKALRVQDFHFNTPNTTLNLEAEATFPSFTKLAEQYGDAAVTMNVTRSSLSARDILYLAPALFDSIPLTLTKDTRVDLEVIANGKLKDFTLERLYLRTLSQTSLEASGTIKGLPDTKRASLNIALKKFYTTAADVKYILPDTMLPSAIALPRWINLAGTIKGTPQAPDAKAILTSDFGAINLRADMDFDSSASENYDAQVSMKKFNLGKLLRQEQTMGPISLQASVKGAGFTMKNINAALKLTIQEFLYNNYSYKNFIIDGSLKKYFFSGIAKLDDKNLNFKLEGDLDYHEDIPRYDFKFDLANADFRALNLSERPLRARGTIDVNLATADFKVINGDLNIRKVAIFNGTKLYAVDSLLFASIDQQGQSEITVNSDILSGEFKGNINIFSLPETLKRHIHRYFSLHDSVFNKPADPQNFDFNLVIKNTDLLTEIIFPDLDPFVPGEIAGAFNSAEHKLWMSVKLAEINYAGLAMDSIGLKVISNEQSLDYTFLVQKVRYDTLRMEALKLSGNVMNDSIYSRFIIYDSLQHEKYMLGGVFNSFEDAFQFRFLRNQVILNYESWSIPFYNTLRFTGGGMTPNNFYISKGNERILLLKREDRDTTMTVVFNEVDLKNITSVVEGTTPVSGIIDGDLNIGVARQGSFNSTLYIRKLAILDQSWGDLALALGKTATGPFNIDLRVDGTNMDLQAAGYITSNEVKPQIHFTTTLNRFDIAAVEPLTMKQVKNMKGQLVGEVRIEGYTDNPEIDGILTFKAAEFTPTIIGSKFTLENESIRLNGTGIALNKFKIKDDKGNQAVLDGTVKSNTFNSYDLALTLNAENFQVINTTEDDNDLFYGNVRINTKAKVTGTSDFPKVQLNASLSKGSEFTYIVPETEKTILEQEGIVRFVDRDAVKDPFLASIEPEDTVTSKFTGIELTANIELNDDEILNIIIDPVTGDKLSVQGNSTLTFDIDETGDMQLSGRYEITQGSYNLSFYKLVKRQFSIEKGSTITWTGNILQPEMNIRALFKVETSPIDLVANQMPSATQDASYKQRLPFLVYLIIEGNLLSPDISFLLDMPQDKQNAFGGSIYAKIKDINTRESDLNKQVFALLILKRFVSDNPLESEGGGSGVASTARNSVSKILTDQLNRLSENIKGVQLSFDVKSYEDYSSGRAEGQTELQLGVSKTLLNDRLVVKVAGNLDVEGSTSNQNGFADYIGDLALEYKLTEDGRLRITGFRNSNYDMIDGELIETGAGFIYIKDYDAFRELFKANAKEN
jgi:translocation and assembly module TamB